MQLNKQKICIATADIIGPILNSGIGTAYSMWAAALASNGYAVTILYLLADHSETQPIHYWVDDYANQNITLVPLTYTGPPIVSSHFAKISYQAFLWLKARENEFDVVHFAERKGGAYYSVLAKHQGLAFQRTTFCIGVHSPTLWSKAGNQEHIDSVDDLVVDFLERESVRLADVVISPCQYMLDWMKEAGWHLPTQVYVQPYIFWSPEKVNNPYTTSSECLLKVKTIVFFGRLEERKGLRIFCQAIELSGLSLRPDLEVVFLGRLGHINNEFANTYIKRQTQTWQCDWKMLMDYSSEQAISYLSDSNKLAVIASLMDNSPYCVIECLEMQIPFLASAVGGIPEQIAEADHERICFVPTAKALAAKLVAAANEGVYPAKPRLNRQAIVAQWMELHEKITFNTTSVKLINQPENYPLVSVCLIHYNRPHYLAQALESLRSQDYPNYEIILVDDASSLPEAQAYLTSLDNEFASKGWQLIRHQENRYADAARNTAFRHSRGEYLLFMDDDNYAKPYEISTFVAVAQRTHADILTCAMDIFDSADNPAQQPQVKRIYLPTGANLVAGIYNQNTFGDMNALIKKSVLTALGGFTEIYGIAHQDWEFFANAVLKGFHLETIPLALFWYRDTPDSLSKTTNVYRNLRRSISPYVAALPPPLRNIVLFSQGQYLLIHRLNQRINEQNKMTAELPNGLKRLGRLMMQELSQRVVNAVRHPLKTVKTLPRKIRDFSIYE